MENSLIIHRIPDIANRTEAGGNGHSTRRTIYFINQFIPVSTGVYHYPAEAAAAVAVAACREFIALHHYSCDIIFACFSERDLRIYRKLLGG
ncbi:MAG: hypothetical protein JW913_16245 [Chitinispirillaceae bacterium]|nr:hypothetical protein [Chitinispirillaceae bacterium]